MRSGKWNYEKEEEKKNKIKYSFCASRNNYNELNWFKLFLCVHRVRVSPVSFLFLFFCFIVSRRMLLCQQPSVSFLLHVMKIIVKINVLARRFFLQTMQKKFTVVHWDSFALSLSIKHTLTHTPRTHICCWMHFILYLMSTALFTLLHQESHRIFLFSYAINIIVSKDTAII